MLRTEVVDEAVGVAGPIVAVVGAAVLAFVLASLISAVVRSMARRSNLALDLIKRARRPLRAVLIIAAVWIALRLSTDSAPWRVTVEHALLIGLIVAVAFLIGALAFVVEDAALARYRMDVPDNRHARRVRTQITVLRRLTVVILAFCAIAGVLMTFPSAQAAGASLFASAGVISIVAGLAAQSSLANVFAGLQLAFTDAIRVDDVVIVEGEWGRIEEITMTYVVVHVWDDRRLIVPSTHFTTTPFQNWTRRDANLLGTVEFDLDWSVPVTPMRAELTRLLDESGDLWDHRVGILQVTEATGGFVQVRALASAIDAPTLFDLRCYVREGLVDWLQREQPAALPRTRIEGMADVAPRATPPAVRPALPAPSAPSLPAPPVPVENPPADVVGGDVAPTPVAPTPDVPTPDVPTPDVPTPDVPAPTATFPVTPPDLADAPVRRSAMRAPSSADTVRIATHNDARLFTGSIDALERAQAFGGPGREVLDEREQTAERALGQTGETAKAEAKEPPRR
ncbi:mechanosensitive ion channel family protein [Pengzhenrongella sicca]|uniref:Mechanosensitive ion channel n=1 Tax=Pengzhenrongella sicca TaxID=2819238 RepID=A0A8A4ZCR3_9MICO|nr:mechanosensitive ion channel domain-containing protein [Pengzhenrongella sicca]QTE29684.1 mechanosensitive ion channel [Pengzhenrongella sicca]